ncbi:glycosyltransferase family 4 protein [Pelagibacteraceae bacterium]|jgi:phosphatidylinositol alpha-1,6-mannosyltransferase|nr:glycosyltransferase family 4 protein [Pelagibacteraceae bacterium]|tara:strand:+ start:908 stop:1999 length:1092 start_codon:yes stop_codon:yes gene_type:complete
MFLISTRNFPPDIGGIQNLMEGLSNALLNHGPVKIFADRFENCEKYDQMSKLDIERVTGFKIFRKYRKANLVKEFIEHNEVRAIFFDHWKSVENINQATLEKTTSFCLIHSKEINHLKETSLNKRMVNSLNKVEHIISNSNFTRNLAIKLGVNENKIKVINPGCNYPIKINTDNKELAKKIFQNASPRLITIARLDGRKSHANILMTIKNLKPKFPNLKYISIGDGEEKNNLIKLKKELNLDDEVQFIFQSDEQTKVALLEQSDLFVMPSVIYKKSIEGFGITYIEAAAYGKGSIGGVYGGEKDAILDGQTGYLCDGNDLNVLYEVMFKCLKNNHYKNLGVNALNFSKKFNWNIIVKKYIELI